MTKSSRTRNTVLNLITGIGGQLLSTILKFVTRTVFISTMGKAYLGISGLFTNILAILALTELGFDTAINFRLYKPIAEKDEHRLRVLMKFYKQVYRIIGTVILVLGVCLIPALRYLINNYDSLEALQINATLIFSLYLLQSVSSYFFGAYRTAIVNAAQKTYVIECVDYTVTVLSNITQILILCVWKNFIAYTVTIIVFTCVKNIVNAVTATRMFPQVFIPEKDNLTKAELLSMFKDCGAMFIYKVNAAVVNATDNLILSAFVGLSIVGMYSNYLLFYTTIKTFLEKLFSSVKASIGNVYATEDVSNSYFYFEVMNFLTIIFFGTACIGIAVVSNELIFVWIGEEYLIRQPLPILLGIEMLFAGIKCHLGQIRNISGAFRQMWFRPLVGIIVNLGISIFLVQFWGIYGVLIGTIVADLVANFMIDPSIIHKYSFKNYKSVSIYYKKNMTYVAILFVVGIVDMFLCSTILPGRGWLSVCAHIFICCFSVLGVFIFIYRKTEVCKYLINKCLILIKNQRV